MTKVRQTRRQTELSELRAWYLERLRPKLAKAANSGSVALPPAATLHERLTTLLDLPRDSQEAP